MSQNSFKLPVLPVELLFSVFEWLHDSEAHNLLRVNKCTRRLIQRRGIVPKCLAEINIRIEPDDDGQFALSVKIFPRNFRGDSQDRQLWTVKNGKPDSEDEAKMRAFKRIKSCKCLSLKPGEVSGGKLQNLFYSKEIFSKLSNIQRLHLSGEPELIEMFLPKLHLKSVEQIYISLLFELVDSIDLKRYWTEILEKQALSECEYLNVELLGENPAVVLDLPTKAKHFEFNCTWFEAFIESLQEILQKGIPEKNPFASAQIRDYLFREDCGEIGIVYKTLSTLIQSNAGVQTLKREELLKTESIQLRHLHHRSSYKYIAETVPSSELTKEWLKESQTESFRDAYFLQIRDKNETVIALYVDRCQWAPKVDVNVVLIPRVKGRGDDHQK